MRLDPGLLDDLTERVLNAAQAVLGDALLAAELEGSVLNDDFIPWYSDFDLHLFADSSVMRGPRSLRRDFTFAFQERIGPLDPDDYQVFQLQIYFVSGARYPEDWTPPIPGTYRVVFGKLPEGVGPLNAEEMRLRAAYGLKRIDRNVDELLGKLVDKADRNLAGTVRLIGTGLKPGARQAATFLGAPPVEVWRWPMARVLELVESELLPGREISQYLSIAARWREARDDPTELRRIGRLGIAALEQLAAFGRSLAPISA